MAPYIADDLVQHCQGAHNAVAADSLEAAAAHLPVRGVMPGMSPQLSAIALAEAAAHVCLPE